MPGPALPSRPVGQEEHDGGRRPGSHPAGVCRPIINRRKDRTGETENGEERTANDVVPHPNGSTKTRREAGTEDFDGCGPAEDDGCPAAEGANADHVRDAGHPFGPIGVLADPSPAVADGGYVRQRRRKGEQRVAKDL